jgi:O-antigen/teichoic acid export membrane protein
MRSIQFRVVYTFFNKVFLSALGFLVSIITARYLTTAGRGIYNYATVYTGVYAAFLGGFGAFGPFAINRLKYDLKPTFRTLMFCYYTISILTFAAFGIVCSSGWIQHDFKLIWIPFFLLASPFLLGFGFLSRLLQGLDEIERLNRANVIQTVVFVIVSGCAWLFFRKYPETFRIYLILTLWVISQVLATGYAIVQIRKSADVSFLPKWDKTIGSDLLKFGSNIAVGNLIEKLNARADFFMVQFMSNLTQLAIYGIAVAASEVMNFVASSITNVIYKRIAGSERKESVLFASKVFRITAMGSLITAIGAVLAFHFLIPVLFGHRYQPATAPFEVLVFGVGLYGLATIFGMYFTNQLSRPRIAIYMDTISIIVNVIVCSILIPRLGIVGAAIGSATSYAVECIVAVSLFKRFTHAKLIDLIVMKREDWDIFLGIIRRRFAK